MRAGGVVAPDAADICASAASSCAFASAHSAWRGPATVRPDGVKAGLCATEQVAPRVNQMRFVAERSAGSRQCDRALASIGDCGQRILQRGSWAANCDAGVAASINA